MGQCRVTNAGWQAVPDMWAGNGKYDLSHSAVLLRGTSSIRSVDPEIPTIEPNMCDRTIGRGDSVI